MAKKAKDKAGRFLRIDFPAEGIDDALDRLFLLHTLNAHNLALATRLQVQVSYTGMHKSKQPEKHSVVHGLRRVK